MKHAKIIVLLTILFASLVGICQTNNSSNNEKTEKKDDFLGTVEELQKDYFKNYWEIEKIVIAKLEKEGAEYFIENNNYNILAQVVT